MSQNHKKSFWSLISTQFFGAFNDNLFKIAVALLVVQWVDDPVKRNNWVSMSGFVFVAPFLLFSLFAGRLSDRWSKARLMTFTKIFEVIVVLVAAAGMLSKSIPLMMGGLFCLAFQSTFFGPAKYGYLPELLPESKLSNANGLLNVFTFVAILLGTVAGTFLIGNIHQVALLMAFVAICGFVSSLFMERLPSVNPNQDLVWNPFPDFVRNWTLIKGNQSLRQSLIAVSFFWFLGAVLQLNTLVYVDEMLGGSTQLSGILLTLVVMGVASGSLLAGKLSQNKVELGLVPLGAVGMSLFTIALYFSVVSIPATMVIVFGLGFFSGLFVIPLTTLIQARSPKEQRGRILATSNFLSFIAILAAAGFFYLLGSALKANSAQIFLTLGLVSCVTTGLIVFTIPQSFIRLLLFFITNTVYKIRVVGRENVPMTGPALLVPNHVSMVDPFLVSGGISRMVRFLMYRDIYEKPMINPFVKLMGAMPISENDSPKEILRSLLQARKKLEEGHLVCIFAEGQISRLGGGTLGFKRGLDVILKDMDVPVIPVHLEGIWGSIFSFEGEKFYWKWPRRIPYPVTVTYGKPLRNVNSGDVRQAVLDLGSDAFVTHRQKEPTLFSSFLIQAKKNPSQQVISDSLGTHLTYHQLLTGAALYGSAIMKKLQMPSLAQKNIGVLLPPSAAGVVVNLALAGKGAVPINLNYTLSKEGVNEICEKAKIDFIITSEKMISKLGWEKESRFVFVEELKDNISKADKLITGVASRIFPAFLLRQMYFAQASMSLTDLATVMFTSGSTGVPKGVMLTQANVLSNIQSLIMVLKMKSDDALLGVLPFFHSFGFTGSLWFPLLAGFKAVYHNNPLDSKTIGNLCREQKVTFLIGTPTFLTAYIRRIPKDDFAFLRFAVAGAEKLRPALAKSFEDKYQVPILEGFGCTELSPVVALNVPDVMDGELLQVGRKVGKIGRPLPGISVKIVNPDTLEPLPIGQSGLLMVKGPNVMKGYLDDPEKTADVIKDGWYITGDIATIDEDGFIEITDRLSRFSKIGGEMVPHIMIEQKLQECTGSTERQFVVTSIPDDKKGEALAVLVANIEGNIDDLWKKLNETDLPKLWIPARDKFFVVEQLPLLGSGKIDIQGVKSKVAELIRESS